MSNHSSGAGGRLTAAVDRTRRVVTTVEEWLPGDVLRPARRVAFWSAVALPFLLLAMLVRGLSTPVDTLAFAALVVVELLALVLGHPYRRE